MTVLGPSLSAGMVMSKPLSGNFKDTPLTEILEELGTRRSTGTLTVHTADAEKFVHMKDGNIIYASSTDAQDRLGEILIREGRLSRENLEAALQLHKRAGGFKKLGALLVEKGFVAPKELFAGLKTQVKEIIYSLFLEENAQYSFEENLPPDVIQLQINIEELILEIIQRIKQEA